MIRPSPGRDKNEPRPHPSRAWYHGRRLTALHRLLREPPGAMLVDLAKALKATSDELLGLKPTQEKTSPKLKIADVHFQGGVGQCGLLTVGR